MHDCRVIHAISSDNRFVKPLRQSLITCVRLSAKEPINSAIEALIASLMERNDCCIAKVSGRNRRSLLLAHQASEEIRLWVVRRSQTRRTNTNEQDTYITVCKILNTKNTETQTDKIIHVINHIRTCRKQISAKLRTADIFAFSHLSIWS